MFQKDWFDSIGTGVHIINFQKEFELVSIMIPEDKNNEWHLNYNSIHDQDHNFQAIFKNWMLVDILIDG
jgi:hypothetical protein